MHFCDFNFYTLSMAKNKLSTRLSNAFNFDNEMITFKDLLNHCKCSQATLRRKIKQIGLLVSYNFNSRFYTLSSLASFNEYGIWNNKGICFSIHGSLVKTVSKLVDNSKAGYTPSELSALLHVRVNDLLREQTKKQALKREKLGRTYVYYSGDDQSYAQQYRERQSLLDKQVLQGVTSVINNRDAVIAILVEVILSGSLYTQVIGQRLKVKSPRINIGQIQFVISQLGLKKTMPKS